MYCGPVSYLLRWRVVVFIECRRVLRLILILPCSAWAKGWLRVSCAFATF